MEEQRNRPSGREGGVTSLRLDRQVVSWQTAIRETGATCGHTAVIFYYGIFPETEKTLGDHGVTLHSLCTWWDVLAEAKAQKAFDEETLNGVEAFLNDPRGWQEANKST